MILGCMAEGNGVARLGPPHRTMGKWTYIQAALANQGYVATDDLAMALHLSMVLGRPLLLEGAAGVGKTEVARALAAAKGCALIRLQCYEGLDAAQAIYEWNYQRQLLGRAAPGSSRGCSLRNICWSALCFGPSASLSPRFF